MLMAKTKELTVTAIVSRNFTPDPLSQFYIILCTMISLFYQVFACPKTNSGPLMRKQPHLKFNISVSCRLESHQSLGFVHGTF